MHRPNQIERCQQNWNTDSSPSPYSPSSFATSALISELGVWLLSTINRRQAFHLHNLPTRPPSHAIPAQKGGTSRLGTLWFSLIKMLCKYWSKSFNYICIIVSLRERTASRDRFNAEPLDNAQWKFGGEYVASGWNGRDACRENLRKSNYPFRAGSDQIQLNSVRKTSNADVRTCTAHKSRPKPKLTLQIDVNVGIEEVHGGPL